MSGPSGPQHQLPPMQLLPPTYPEPAQANLTEPVHDGQYNHPLPTSNAESYSTQNLPAPQPPSYADQQQAAPHPPDGLDYLNSPEEVLFMQVFVEEVGLWMDSMDPMKHVCNDLVALNLWPTGTNLADSVFSSSSIPRFE